MTWSDLGSITITASDLHQDLGPISIGPDDDTLWLRVTQTSPTGNWRYSFGIVSFITSEGAELGSTKVYGNQLGEVFALSVRRPPLDGSGIVRFIPRHYNLQWVSAQGAPNWGLAFEWDSGQSGNGSPVFGTRATLGSLADIGDTGVSYAINNGFARIKLTSQLARLWPTFDSQQLIPTTQPSFQSPATPRENSN